MRTLEDARRALRVALDGGDLDRARRTVRGFPALRGPAEALLWTELLWADREHPDRVAIAETLLDAFPEHGEIVRPCAEILLDALPGFVPGEAPAGAHLARRAVAALSSCIGARSDYGADARALLERSLASALSMVPDLPGEVVEETWARCLEHDPADGPGWFELALWLKYRGRFREALGAALQANAHLGGREPVVWNIGICATGCGLYPQASEAWRALGFPVEPDPRGVPRVPGLPDRTVRIVTSDPVYGRPDAVRQELDVVISPLGPCDGIVREQACEWPEACPGLRPGTRILHDATPVPGEGPPRLPALAILG